MLVWQARCLDDCLFLERMHLSRICSGHAFSLCCSHSCFLSRSFSLFLALSRSFFLSLFIIHEHAHTYIHTHINMHKRNTPITHEERGSCLERIRAPTRGDGERSTKHTTTNTLNQDSIKPSNNKQPVWREGARKRQSQQRGERKRDNNVSSYQNSAQDLQTFNQNNLFLFPDFC